MSKTIFLIPVCVFLFCLHISYGQNLEEISKSYRECLESGIPTTQSSLNCTYSYLLKYESFMVKKLNDLTEKLPDPLAEKLFDNQIEWKRWMKSEISFYQAFYTKVYEAGSLVRSAVLNKKMELTKKRIVEIENRIDWLTR
jgi:uncharacterized protein YecT (DUF1311 family)